MSGLPWSDQKVAGITSREPEAVKLQYLIFQTGFWGKVVGAGKGREIGRRAWINTGRRGRMTPSGRGDLWVCCFR
jgi:hypothetical protein